MRESGSTLTLSARSRSNRVRALAFVFLAVLNSACGAISNSSSSSALTTDCILPADQGATLTGRWMRPAVPIAFQAGAWNPSEIQAMITAANTWNNFFAASMGYPAIDYGTAANPRTSTIPLTNNMQDFCINQTILNSDYTFSGVIVIYKDGTWNSAYGVDTIALTTTCRNLTTTRKLAYFQNGFMEVNYVNFFVNGNRVPDLQSIVLHEMGHLMGINHSCARNSTTVGIPNCDNPIVDPTYLHASMYPSFTFYSSGTGEMRRSLNSNDMGRTNCAYKFL